MPNKVPVTFHLTTDQRARLRALSKRGGLSVAEMIRRAVDAYLEKDAKKQGKGDAK